MSRQSEVYSESTARKAALTLEKLGLASWSEAAVVAWQKEHGVSPADGWLGPDSLKSWKTRMRVLSPPVATGEGLIVSGSALIGGQWFAPPPGVTIVNHREPGGIPANLDDTSPRTRPVTQFVIHRGAETKRKNENYAQATERVLDERGLSTTFSMDVDGAIYQHFDPATIRGRHCTHYNVTSDSLDVGGPFSAKEKPVAGQTLREIKVAIGRGNDGRPPLARKMVAMKCWSLTPAQAKALALFLPWWCRARSIPVRACSDLRTWRVGGLGLEDPATYVPGILGHLQVSGPGDRVDGALCLLTLQETGADIEWRQDFFEA